MRVVSIKSSVCSCVSSVGKKNYSDLSLRGDSDPHSFLFVSHFSKIWVFSRREWGGAWVPGMGKDESIVGVSFSEIL